MEADNFYFYFFPFDLYEHFFGNFDLK